MAAPASSAAHPPSAAAAAAGWYGGGGGVTGGGGGGSGYGPPGTPFQTGLQVGDGVVLITYAPTTIDDLIESVQDLNLPSGTTRTLLAKLNRAQNALAGGNVTAACNQLAAFVTQVKTQSGKKIPAPAAADLISAAQAVRCSVNCGAGLTCAGQAATIVGSARDETLRGTKGDDVIVAGDGGDRVIGLKGDDLICGSGGADVILGGGGDDRLKGGARDDVLRGGGGSDRCRGGRGPDRKRHC